MCIRDRGQTVSFTKPSIGTSAAGRDGGKVLVISKTATIVDTVAYKGLSAGQKYTCLLYTSHLPGRILRVLHQHHCFAAVIDVEYRILQRGVALRPVSYTHLDVYKRQEVGQRDQRPQRPGRGNIGGCRV